MMTRFMLCCYLILLNTLSYFFPKMELSWFMTTFQLDVWSSRTNFPQLHRMSWSLEEDTHSHRLSQEQLGLKILHGNKWREKKAMVLLLVVTFQIKSEQQHGSSWVKQHQKIMSTLFSRNLFQQRNHLTQRQSQLWTSLEKALDSERNLMSIWLEALQRERNQEEAFQRERNLVLEEEVLQRERHLNRTVLEEEVLQRERHLDRIMPLLRQEMQHLWKQKMKMWRRRSLHYLQLIHGCFMKQESFVPEHHMEMSWWTHQVRRWSTWESGTSWPDSSVFPFDIRTSEGMNGKGYHGLVTCVFCLQSHGRLVDWKAITREPINMRRVTLSWNQQGFIVQIGYEEQKNQQIGRTGERFQGRTGQRSGICMRETSQFRRTWSSSQRQSVAFTRTTWTRWSSRIIYCGMTLAEWLDHLKFFQSQKSTLHFPLRWWFLLQSCISSRCPLINWAITLPSHIESWWNSSREEKVFLQMPTDILWNMYICNFCNMNHFTHQPVQEQLQ